MARKNNERNPLQIRLKAESLPKSVKPKAYYRRLLEYIVNDGRFRRSGKSRSVGAIRKRVQAVRVIGSMTTSLMRFRILDQALLPSCIKRFFGDIGDWSK